MNPLDLIAKPPLGNIVAMDPAISGNMGVAVFVDGELKAAWDVQNILNAKEHSTLERAHYTASLVRAHTAFPTYAEAKGFTLVAEEPVVYPGSPVPPNDLLKVAIMSSIFVGFPWARAFSFTPVQWKGQVKKGPHHKRLLLQHPEYRKLLQESGPDAMDAFGLGIYYLKQQRLEAHGTS